VGPPTRPGNRSQYLKQTLLCAAELSVLIDEQYLHEASLALLSVMAKTKNANGKIRQYVKASAAAICAI
jgi:hypothetical protein